MDRFVNMDLIRNPWNWVIILSFVVVGTLLLREVGRLAQGGQVVAGKAIAKTISGVNAVAGGGYSGA